MADSHSQGSTVPLRPWMRFVLRFAGTFNLLAGAAMIALYHEGYKMLGIPRPQLVLPDQIMGVLVGLFGVGYHLVANHPIENRSILLLGFWSKAISSAFVLWYVAVGQLPLWFVAAITLSDIIYLPPFYVIWRRLSRLAAGQAGPSPAPDQAI